MANRSNHYEAAFEAYIRSIRVPCVAVDEAKRALFGEEGVKNPDFLLYPRCGPNLVVEVKGKRGKNARGRRPWENWVTTDDLDGLARWQEMFGPGLPGDPGLRLRRALAAVPAAAGTMGRSRSGGSTIASGRSASTTTSPTSAREARPGRRWPWPARPSAAGSARSANGSR